MYEAAAGPSASEAVGAIEVSLSGKVPGVDVDLGAIVGEETELGITAWGTLRFEDSELRKKTTSAHRGMAAIAAAARRLGRLEPWVGVEEASPDAGEACWFFVASPLSQFLMAASSLPRCCARGFSVASSQCDELT